MTNTDKTRQKLVNSMRKSKDAAAKQPTPQAAPGKSAAAIKKTAKKSRPAGGAPATAPKSTAPAKPRAQAAKARQVAADPYQGGRRGLDDPYQGRRQATADAYQGGRLVWPD